MGFTVRFILGTVLVLVCFWLIESAQLSRFSRQVSEKAENGTVTNLTSESIKPKTELTTETNNVVSKLQKSESYKKAVPQPEVGRAIDIEKYVSKEFHNKNNVYTLPLSEDTQKFIDPEFAVQSTTHKHEFSENFDFHTELTTPKSSIFDHKYKEAVESVDQKLEHIDESHEISSESESKESVNLEKLLEDTKQNDTKANLDYVNYKNILSNDTGSRNNLHKDIVIEDGTNLNFHSSFNHTTVIDEDDSRNNTIVKLDDERKIETSTLSNLIPVKGDLEIAESSTTKNIVLTTRKSATITKPPSNKNSSLISILSNNIETDTVKAINTQAILATTEKPKGDVENVSEVLGRKIDIVKRPSTVAAVDKKPEQLLQENQIVSVHVAAPENHTESTTELTATTEISTTSEISETTTTPEVITTTRAENETTELPSTTTQYETTEIPNFETTEIPNFETTVTPNAETTISSTFLADSTETTENVETTTVEVIKSTTDVVKSTTEVATSTTEVAIRTSKGLMLPETTTSQLFTTSKEVVEVLTTTTEEEMMTTVETIHVSPKFRHLDTNTDSTESENTTDNNTITSEFYEHTDVPEDNSGTIAAITISSIGAVCLILLVGLLVIMRKRQKRFNYGQRCRPVSLDDYSMDNVSVYNSVRRKGMLRGSKRSYGNPAFEDPASVSHPLNFPALGKFATNSEDIQAEFEEIPQITARTNELPEGCDTKNRYANVIPLPETRVFLNVIEGQPNSDYINANYVTGPKNTKGYYIACQAPMQNTVDDFWRMVWEQQTKVILMLTLLFENGVEKCVDYLPPSEVLDCHRLFGDFQVTLKKREVKEKYIISSLQLKNMVSNSWREVTHFWYLGWPEKGVPSEANSLIAFLIEARSYMKSSSLDRKDVTNGNLTNGMAKNELNPVVVHCSPGTGRTGVVIACDIAIREFEQNRLVDIPRIVYRIRRDRASAVQTKDQYAFIYKVVSLYATKLTGGALDSL